MQSSTLVNIEKVLVQLLKANNEDVQFMADQMAAGSSLEDGGGEVEGVDGVEKTVGGEGSGNEMEEMLQ